MPTCGQAGGGKHAVAGERLHVGMVLPSLRAGGAERVTLTLAEALMARGHRVDLLVARSIMAWPEHVPEGLALFWPWWGVRKAARSLAGRRVRPRTLRVTPAAAQQWRLLARKRLGVRVGVKRAVYAHMIARYMRSQRPAVLLAALPTAAASTLYAAALTGDATPVVVALHSSYRRGELAYLPMARALYPRAAALIAVSRAVQEEAEALLDLPSGDVETIHNPVPAAHIRRMARHDVAHPWFAPGSPPVVLTVGRGAPEKDYPTLVRAFARVRRETAVRLVFLGLFGTRLRASLLAEATRLGVGKDVAFVRFDANPFRYMRRAAVFVLSSRQEALPTVIIEALACGTPVVSTDAPHGPREILQGGRLGKLAPVGEAAPLAEAMLATLRGDHAARASLLGRAECFSAERAARRYEAVFRRVAASGLPSARGVARREREPCGHGRV